MSTKLLLQLDVYHVSVLSIPVCKHKSPGVLAFAVTMSTTDSKGKYYISKEKLVTRYR
ncbi:hypothetical protein LguiA_016024 [Lonicera macranthoides]